MLKVWSVCDKFQKKKFAHGIARIRKLCRHIRGATWYYWCLTRDIILEEKQNRQIARDRWIRDRVKILWKLERASKDANSYIYNASRASVSFIERSRSSRVPHGNLSLRQVGETGTSLSPTLLPTCMDDAWTSESWKREPRFECACSRGANRNSFVPDLGSGARCRSVRKFCQ